MDISLVERIVEREWSMFSTVSNVGGPASCQFEPATFRIMRTSQICDWPEPLLQSYHSDLMAAEKQGRNLMSEKYARMMESTFPDEYREIAPLLPEVDAAALAMVEDIVAAHVAWKMETAQKYPLLTDRGRAVLTKDDTRYGTSFETYLRGELKTYSPQTIRLLYEYTMDQKRCGENGTEATLLRQVNQYGYATLEDAEYQNKSKYGS